MSKSKLPPNPLPSLSDPALPNEDSIYRHSSLRVVCGTRINPDAIGWYKRKDLVTDENCPVKTALHPEIEAWIGNIEGYDPRSKTFQPELKDAPLSAIIPQVVPKMNGTFSYELYPASYLVNAVNIQSNPITYPEQPIGIKNNLPEGSQLLLGWFGEHTYIQGIWPRVDFWELEFLKEFDAILLPVFSAFCDDPIPQYLMGERMQQIFAEEGAAAGYNVIPTVAWASEDSLRRQIELWMSLYPKVNTIAFDCLGSGVNRTKWIWRWLFAIEKYLAGIEHIRFIFTGLNSGWAIRELNEMFPNKNYHLVSSRHEYIRATSGTSDTEIQSKKFRQHLKKLEDFRSGENLADKASRPEVWPTFNDLKQD